MPEHMCRWCGHVASSECVHGGVCFCWQGAGGAQAKGGRVGWGEGEERGREGAAYAQAPAGASEEPGRV